MVVKKAKGGINRNGIYFQTSGMPIVWRVGIYIRLSVADGKEVSLSVENQEAINKYFLETEFSEPYTLYKIYIDDGISGTTDDERNAFQEMIQDIEDGNINCVVSKMLARVFRNYSDQGYYLEEYFPRMGIRFITLEAPKVDTFMNPNMVNGYELPLTGIVNDRYAESTSIAVRQSLKNMRREGKFQGGFAPYGYLRDPDDKYRFIIDEEAANVVRQIFRWFAHDRMGMEAIRKKLNETGVLNPTGYKRSKGYKYCNPGAKDEYSYAWTSTTIKNTLRNRTYLGDMVQGKSTIISYKVHKAIKVPEEQWNIVPNMHDAIIDEEIFNKAQELLELNKTIRGYYGSKPALLSGILFCRECGKRMHKRKSGSRTYYACTTYYKRNKDDCTSHFIRDNLVYAAILEAIQRQIALVDMDQIIDEVSKKENSIETARHSYQKKLIEDKKLEIANLDNQLENLYFDYNKRILNDKEYNVYKKKLCEKKEKAEEAINMALSEIAGEKMRPIEQQRWKEVLLQHKNITELNRQVLEELIDRIYIDQDKNITIKFKYGDIFKEYMNEKECTS